MFQGWFCVGGTEIGNNARARGYAESADCPVGWFVGDDCDTLADALGQEGDYNLAQISQAPWYDPDDESTHRFYGAYITTLGDISSSTRTGDFTEGIVDGGIPGRTRHTGKTFRVRAWLTAAGEDALETGHQWLDAALRSSACSTHSGGTCGATDATFFTACPPARASVGEFTPWTQRRENLFLDPAVTSTDQLSTGGAVFTVSHTGTAARFTVQTPGNAQVNFSAPGIQPGAQYRLLIRARASSDVSTLIGDALVTLGTDWTWLDGAPVAVGSEVQLAVNGTLPVGGWVEIDHVLVASPTDVGDWFQGDSAPETPTSLERTTWAGAVNQSTSLLDMRSVQQRPQTRAEYDDAIAPLIRHLHNVTCISGPLEIETRRSSDRIHWGRLVEFTLYAGKPWLYGETRSLNLSPTPATVVQDVPFNLMPTPSAEVAGDPVVVATNYSTNPSVEVNTTGWTMKVYSDPASTPDVAPYASTGRVIGELAASGTASLRMRILGNATEAANYADLQAEQTVDISARPAGARVSISVWAAMINVGSTVAARLDALYARVFWLDSGGATISGDLVGQDITEGGNFGGSIFAQKSMLPPAGTASARVLVGGYCWWTSGTNKSDIRMYVDALAVTVP